VRDIDARSDVFSLGCVLFECVTGWRPFAGEHSLAVRTKIVLGSPPPVQTMAPEAPAALVALLDRMLAKRPDDRPRDGNEVAAALAALPAIGAGPRRRTSDDEPSTFPLHGRRELDFVVLAVHDASREPTLVAELERIVTQIDRAAEVAQLDSGVVLVRIPGDRDPRSRVEVALRCARALQQRLPDAPVAIAGMSPGVDELDRVVHRLIGAVVASAKPPPLLVDDSIRPYLQPDRPIV